MINRELDAFFSKNGTDEYPDSAETCGSLVGISPRLIPYYCSIAECAKKSNYLADNEVILYLPNRYQNSKTVSESLIKEGDNITFTYLDQEYSLTVAGIIRDLDNEPFCYQIPRPYSLICSQSTYDRICGKNDYVYILVKRDNKSIAYQTDAELSKIKTSLFFTNNRITKEEYKNNTYMQLLIALLISSAGIVMVILARYGIQMVTNKYEIYRYKTLYQLGMEVRRIRSALRVDAVIESFLAVIIATLAELIWIYIRTRAVYTTASFMANSKLELFMQVAKAFVTSTHWWFVVGMAIIMFIINYLLLAMKSHILIKNLAQD